MAAGSPSAGQRPAGDARRRITEAVVGQGPAGGARRRIVVAWRSAGPLGRSGLVAGAVAGVLLAGAFVFGSWHVAIGWIVKGNPRAGLFGLVLAATSGAALAGGTAVARRLLTGRGGGDSPGA